MAKKKLEGATSQRGTVAVTLTPQEIENLRVSENIARYIPHGGQTEDDWVLELALSIAKEGQRSRIKVRQINVTSEDDTVVRVLEGITGRHRTKAFLLINSDLNRFGLDAPMPMLAELVDVSDIEALQISAWENRKLKTGPLDFMSQALHLKKLDPKLKTSQIAELMHLSSPRISQVLCLNRLPEEMKEHLHNKLVKEADCRQVLSGIFADDEIVSMSQLISSGEMDSKGLSKLCQARKRKNREETARAEGRVIRFKRSIPEILGMIRQAKSERSKILAAWCDGDPVVSDQVALACLSDDTDELKRVVESEKEWEKMESTVEENLDDSDTETEVEDLSGDLSSKEVDEIVAHEHEVEEIE